MNDEPPESDAQTRVRRALTDPVHWVEVLAELHRWATPAMAASEVPVFGSAAWCALADEDPTKAFGAARAAMAWWNREQAAARRDVEAHVQASHAISAAEDWNAACREPSFSELARRRQAS